MNEKLNMATISIFKNIILCISFYCFLFSNCEKSSGKNSNLTKSTQKYKHQQTQHQIYLRQLEKDLRANISKPFSLLQLNEEYPNNPEIIVQMARALFEDKQFELAAFRFDQANSDQKTASLNKEAGLAYEYA